VRQGDPPLRQHPARQVADGYGEMAHAGIDADGQPRMRPYWLRRSCASGTSTQPITSAEVLTKVDALSMLSALRFITLTADWSLATALLPDLDVQEGPA
jgi:hypothetical protein